MYILMNLSRNPMRRAAILLVIIILDDSLILVLTRKDSGILQIMQVMRPFGHPKTVEMFINVKY